MYMDIPYRLRGHGLVCPVPHRIQPLHLGIMEDDMGCEVIVTSPPASASFFECRRRIVSIPVMPLAAVFPSISGMGLQPKEQMRSGQENKPG